MPPEALALVDHQHMRIFAEVRMQQAIRRVAELERQNEELRALVRWAHSKLAWCRQLMIACGYTEFVYILDTGHKSSN